MTIEIYRTERRHWLNGFDRRGTFWCYAFSLGRLGVMITNSRVAGFLTIYRLTTERT